MRVVVAVCVAWLSLASSAMADTRVALVIGNSTYSRAGALSNPKTDTDLMAKTLEGAGFKVTLVQDATRSAMVEALEAFSDEADQADWALVYYAGHGIEAGGMNYLLPTDVKLRSDRDAQDEAISLSRVLGAVENARKLRLVILDACRTNPFGAMMKRSIAVRAVDRGLAPVEAPAGILVVYSAAAGQVAEDGKGDHSPFAAALARRIQEPGLEVSRLFNVVTADVLGATGQRQRPYQYGSNPSIEEFFFTPPAPNVVQPGPSGFEQTWVFLKTSTDMAALQAFLDALPADHPLRKEVQARIAALREAAAQPLAPTTAAQEAPKPKPGPVATLTPASDLTPTPPPPTPLSPVPAPSVASTQIRDATTLRRLKNNRGIALQWISWDYFGRLNVTDSQGLVHLEGSQSERKGPGRLEVSGNVVSVERDRFTFRGRIDIRMAPSDRKDCLRDGEFEFRLAEGRRYWRLQQMEACEGLTDYVDIFF